MTRTGASRHIYLVRHGEHVRGEGVPGGTTPSGAAGAEGVSPVAATGNLTSKGRRQAEALGRYLVGRPLDLLRCSTMTRAMETAALLAGFREGVRPHASDVFRECLPGPSGDLLQGLGLVGEDDPRLGEGLRRGEAAFEEMIRSPGPGVTHEILVAHGNLIRYLVCRVLDVPPTAWGRMVIHHCSLTWIAVDGQGRLRLVQFGGIDHMPPELRTTG